MTERKNEGQRCERCRYWQCTGRDEQTDLDVGSCHRRAPRDNNRFPKVFESDWCGDFELSVHVEGAYADGAGEAEYKDWLYLMGGEL